MKSSAQANFRIPTDLVKELRRRAKRERRFPAHLVAEALRSYFDRDTANRIPKDDQQPPTQSA